MLSKLEASDLHRADLEKLRDQSDSSRDLNFKELREEFLALQVQQNELMTRLLAGGGAPLGAGGGGAAAVGLNRPQYFATCQSKVGFPIFSGDDLAGWILRCDHFFTVDMTPDEAKVRLAIINFEDRALQWYKNWARYQERVLATPWVVFLQALEGRFGDHLLGDLMTELLALKQTGSFADYHDKFELLLGRVTLTEAYAISHFINGLRPSVQRAVRLFMPQTLVHAYALARLQDLSTPTKDGYFPPPKKQGELRSGGTEPRGSSYMSSSLLPTPVTSFKNRRYISPEEMADCRAKGLCYGCKEKFERGHVCAKKLLYLLEIDEGVREFEAEDNPEVGAEETCMDDSPVISIHAISGSPKTFSTMRVTGRVGKKSINILIDSGSTHNFLDLHLAKRLGLKFTAIKSVLVDVADENRL